MAKSFVLQLASLVTLIVSIPAFIVLLFSIINLKFPDAAQGVWEASSSQDSIRYTIAILVIFFPAYLVTTRLVNKARRQEGELYHTLTKWLIYLALLIGGMVMLGDLAVVVYTFLNGEITVRFLLKAAVILAVIGAAFYYYAADAKGYWQEREKQSLQLGGVALFLVLMAAVYGYYNIDAPGAVREMRLDEQQLMDLQDMQWRIEAYYQETDSFPANLEDVYSDFPVPQAPEGREAYSYRITGANTYELCATFAAATPESQRSIAKPIAEPGLNLNNHNWEHGAGKKCFSRTAPEVPTR